MSYGQMIGNTLYGCIGSHGNGSSCYIGCDKILIAYNYYPKSNLALQSIKNAVVFANVLNYEEISYFTCAVWADGDSRTEENQLFLHNTILGDSSNAALLLPGQKFSPFPQNYVINNIIDGCNYHDNSNDIDPAHWQDPILDLIDISHNLYTGYNGYQSARYGWALKTGEIDGLCYNLKQLFTNPGVANGGDYTLTANSPVIGKGKNLSNLLDTIGVTTWFPDFDFTKDKAGNTWANPPSMGAYEYAVNNVFYGDLSGDSAISAYDAALCARIAVGLDAYPTGDNLTKADVSGDKQVTAYDAALIAQKAVGLIVKFPVE
jgi:hypothetical protein